MISLKIECQKVNVTHHDKKGKKKKSNRKRKQARKNKNIQKVKSTKEENSQ
jgi:hypothetical protein